MNLYYFEAEFNENIENWLKPIFNNDLFTEYRATNRKGLFVRFKNYLIDCYE